ncbi:MAG: AhpC/TSA family protein [Bacteroidales bacterium]|nr:AhpC/TSA family protein [Bacteroidales bacterium]
MKRILYLICGLIILSSCNNSNQLEITGTIENGEEKNLKFGELLVTGTEEIETIQLDKKGNFKFKLSSDIPRFYNLSVSKNNFLTLLLEPGETVRITAKASDISKAKINGSESSVLVQKLNDQLVDTKEKLDSITNYLESIKGTEKFNQQIDEINKSYAEIVNRQRDSSIAFIVSNLNSLASIVALYQKYDDKNYVLYKNRDLQYIKIVSESLTKKHPDSQHVKALLANKDDLLKRYNQAITNLKVNEFISEQSNVLNFPEIYLPNQSGDSISLNQTKAKYLLINFWASWSEESVKRNLELKDIYKKYHSKGFEIYQISLDTKTENWVKSINFDQLPWINVIDLNGRMSYYAKIYNVRTLPTSYLINPKGEITLVNPSKEQLISMFEHNLR